MDNRIKLNNEELDTLIQNRINNFWGYGNLKGKTWFIGMEEGTNQNIENLITRLRETSNGEVFDLVEDFRSDPRHVNWFKNNAPTQSTYRALIYINLYLNTRRDPTLEEIRQYQIDRFGRRSSDHALLELMPLPSKSIREQDWLYASSGAEGLRTRKDYLNRYKPDRVEKLRELIKVYKPKLVVFYSLTYLLDWQKITGVTLHEVIPKKLYIAIDLGTVYAVTPHSTSFGMSTDDWRNISEKLAEHIV